MQDIDKLIEQNEKLVYHIWNKRFSAYETNWAYKDDLIQIGRIALWKACLNFDPSKGSEFSSYACQAIYNDMLCAITRKYNKLMSNEVSYDTIVYTDPKGNIVTIADTIPSEDAFDAIEMKVAVEQFLSTCKNPRTRYIIEKKLDGYSQIEIARELGLSKSYVSLICSRAKKKFKAFMEA